MTENNFILGVNYWPRKKAMTMWKKFDAEEIRQDFRVIADLGMTLVRIFLLWQDFQPVSPSEVDETALRNLDTVAEIALELNLKLDVTFFTGHMSGPNFCPNWLLFVDDSGSYEKNTCCQGSNPHKLQVVVRRDNNNDNNNENISASSSNLVQVLEAIDAPYRNPFHDKIALEAQRLLIRKVVSRFVPSSSSSSSSSSSHHKLCDAIQMWNLGNEIDLVAFPRTVQEGIAWAELLSNEIRNCYPHHHLTTIPKITTGLHCDSLRFSSNNLPVGGIFSKMDMQVMHAYPMYVSFLRESDPLNTNFVPFSCVLTSVLTAASARAEENGNTFHYANVLCEEFGGATAGPGAPSQTWKWKSKNTGGATVDRSQFMASEEDYAEYLSHVLVKLHACGCSGAVLWSFADYSSEIWQEPPCRENYHERYFGLVRPDGSIKPHALVVKEFAKLNLKVRDISSTPELMEMYRQVHQSLNKVNGDGAGDSSLRRHENWVKENADENSSNDASVERVFRNFEDKILPQISSNSRK